MTTGIPNSAFDYYYADLQVQSSTPELLQVYGVGLESN
jgi:hypothetical protein